jgi:polyhydroxyalkanoate depolymerase
MMYATYEAQRDLLAPMRTAAELTLRGLAQLPASWAEWMPVRSLTAASDFFLHSNLTHVRPDFGIESVQIGATAVAVREEIVDESPFASLVHFVKDTPAPGPRVLLVAPLSGHFATMLRDTVRTMLVDCDVYVTDWHNARDVPVEAGRFGLDEYVDHVLGYFEALGAGSHVVAVCQPCVPVLAAAAILARQKSPLQPRSMTLMAGPIDTRINPTDVNELATGHSLEWFERNLTTTVPCRYAGAGRKVYPGFLQLGAFMAMNLERHAKSRMEILADLVNGDAERARSRTAFYDEYFAVLDLTAEFYLEVVGQIFQEHRLARGELTWRGIAVEPGAIKRTALLTVEGERDDICAPGQTLAAHDLCTGIRATRKRHHLQAGVGHYGVFSGRHWQHQIYPVVRNVILAHD